MRDLVARRRARGRGDGPAYGARAAAPVVLLLRVLHRGGHALPDRGGDRDPRPDPGRGQDPLHGLIKQGPADGRSFAMTYTSRARQRDPEPRPTWTRGAERLPGGPESSAVDGAVNDSNVVPITAAGAVPASFSPPSTSLRRRSGQEAGRPSISAGEDVIRVPLPKGLRPAAGHQPWPPRPGHGGGPRPRPGEPQLTEQRGCRAALACPGRSEVTEVDVPGRGKAGVVGGRDRRRCQSPAGLPRPSPSGTQRRAAGGALYVTAPFRRRIRLPLGRRVG